MNSGIHFRWCFSSVSLFFEAKKGIWQYATFLLTISLSNHESLLSKFLKSRCYLIYRSAASPHPIDNQAASLRPHWGTNKYEQNCQMADNIFISVISVRPKKKLRESLKNIWKIITERLAYLGKFLYLCSVNKRNDELRWEKRRFTWRETT
jgi:hypothetical protein